METKANYVAVGIFVLSCVFALVLAVLWLAGAQYREEFASYRTFFQGPVTGLGEGTVVRYNGIDVGRVGEVNFDPQDPRRVIAILQIDPEIRLRTDSYASLESQGLTGVTYVEISGGTPTAPFLVPRPGEEIPTIPYRPSTFQRIVESAPQLLDRLNTMAARGNDLLSEQNRQAFTDTLTNLSEITTSVNSHTQDIDQVLADLNATMRRLDRAVQTADRALTTADTALSSVGKAGDNIATLATNTDQVITRDAAELTRLVADARALMSSLTRLSSELERQPTQLIFGDRRPGYTPQ